MEIAGPDDPMAPLSTMGEPDGGSQGGFPYVFGCYMPFGGTSGASPHVAGSVALLVQQMPDAPAQEVVNALISGAVQEEFMGELPNKEWGFGKVNVYQSAFDSLPEDNEPPVAVAQTIARKGLTATLSSANSMDPEETALLYRWDFEYDGTWNTPWLEADQLEYTFPAKGEVTVKLVVRDEAGAVDEVLHSFAVDPDSIWPEPVVEVEPEEPAGGDVVSVPDVEEEVVAAKGEIKADNSRSGCGAGPGSRSLPTVLLLLLLVLALPALGRSTRLPRG